MRLHFDQRGNAAVTAMAILPMMGFCALVIDIGALQLAKTELQIASDAAALAGVAYLDDTDVGLERAIRAAQEYATSNTALGQHVKLTQEQIVPGYFDPETERFISSDDPTIVNALLIEADAGQIPTMFASAAFGKHFMSTRVESLARRGGYQGAGEVDCFLPIAIPDCYLSREGIESLAIRMTSANEDNAGWARINESPNAAYVKDQILGTCSSGPASIDDLVGLQNGQITSAMAALQQVLEASETPWDEARWGPLPPQMGTMGEDGDCQTSQEEVCETKNGKVTCKMEDVLTCSGVVVENGKYAVSTIAPDRYGRVYQGPIILFETPAGTCGADTQFNGFAQITGFAWAVLYDIDSTGSEKDIRMKLDFTHEHDIGTRSGGLDANVVYESSPGLVF